MTYVVNQIIRVGEYNSFAGASGTSTYGSEPGGASITGGASLGLLYGPGYGSWGYNQSDISLSAVTTADLYRTGQWTNLRNILANIRTHQTGSVDVSVPPTSVFAVDHVVEAHNSAAPTSNPYDLQNAINAAVGNRFLLAAPTLISLTSMTRSTAWGSGVSSLDGVFSCTWADADAAGFFFNTGGYIRFNFVQPVTTTQDADWSDAFTNRIATLRFGAKSTINTGSVPITTALGYYALTGSYQTVWTGSVNGFVGHQYVANSVTLQAKVTGSALHGRPGSVVSLWITCADNFTSGFGDQVSLGTQAVMAAVKDTTNLSTIPATPVGAIVSNW